MKIQIQGYWGLRLLSPPTVSPITPEEYLKKNPEIHICDVIIDEKVVGTVSWNGEELGIAFRDDTLAKEFKECIITPFFTFSSMSEKADWDNYLEKEIKPHWPTLYNFLKSKRKVKEVKK